VREPDAGGRVHDPARPFPAEVTRWAFAGLCWAICSLAVLALLAGWRALLIAPVLVPAGVVAALASGKIRFVRAPCPVCGSRWAALGPEHDPRADLVRWFERTPRCCRCGRIARDDRW
jgi:hypothetical protein